MKRLLIFLGFLSLSVTANAGFTVEPYVGYEFGTFTPKSTTNTHTANGPVYGARLGYDVMGLGFGAEYMGSSLSISGVSPSETQSGSDIGAYVSFKFPALIRVYGTYFFSSSASVSNVSGGDFSGSGYKLGVALTTLPFININFEMVSRDYDKQNSQSLSSGDQKNSDFDINISLPLP